MIDEEDIYLLLEDYDDLFPFKDYKSLYEYTSGADKKDKLEEDIQTRIKNLRDKRKNKLKPKCECGGEKARTTQARWCPINE